MPPKPFNNTTLQERQIPCYIMYLYVLYITIQERLRQTLLSLIPQDYFFQSADKTSKSCVKLLFAMTKPVILKCLPSLFNVIL